MSLVTEPPAGAESGSGFTYPGITAALITLLVLLIGRVFLTYGKRGDLYPPGPSTRPIIGNANLLPQGNLHLKFAEWARQYGDCVSVKVLNKTIIVLHSPTLVKEVFDKNGASNSNRPNNPIVEMITPNNLNFGTARFANETWKVMRKASQSLLTARNLEKFSRLHHAEATQMMIDIIHKPDDFMMHSQRYTTSFFLALVYGTRGARPESPEVRNFLDVHHRLLNALNPATAPPLDILPILKYTPERFATWKREAKELSRLHDQLYTRLTKQVRARLDSGKGNGCFMEDAILNAAEIGMKDEEWLKNLGGTLLEGSDTTAVTIQNSIVCAVAFPEKQALAAAEIERVIGPNRIPRLEDIENLPYTRAFIKESIRFVPAVPLGIPHEMNKDEIIGGYLFPKDAVLFMNTWFIYHDERYFEKPEEFIPERFLNHPFGVKPEVQDDPARRDNYLFGGGRRICPGIASAKTSLDVIMPYLLWAFDFKAPLDPATGKEVKPELNFGTGVVATPIGFNCRIIPKSERHVALIREEFRNAADELRKYEVEISEDDAAYNRKYRGMYCE